jgi:hypothetical protein
MDEKNIEYKVDVGELLKQAFNSSMNKMLIDAIPQSKEKDRKQFAKLLVALNKRGVSTQIFMEAILESVTEE